MKANQNTLVGSPHNTTDTTNGQATLLPRCRSKAEIRAGRMSWAIWAAGIHSSALKEERERMKREASHLNNSESNTAQQ